MVRGILARASAAAWLAAVAMLVPMMAGAQDADLEARVKAAFLLRFLDYVEWPVEPLRIELGLLDAEPVARELERAIGAGVPTRRVQLRRLREGDALDGLHVVYVAGRRTHQPEVVRAARNPGLLVVAEYPDALDDGAVINFVPADGRVRFEVGLATAERLGLRLSSRLLAVAIRVRTTVR